MPVSLEMSESIGQDLNDLNVSCNEEKSAKSPTRCFNDLVGRLEAILGEKKRTLTARIQDTIPCYLGNLEVLVIEHMKFESELQALEPQINECEYNLQKIKNKTSVMQTAHENLMDTWKRLWDVSHVYIERLKAVEISLHSIDEATRAVCSAELQLSAYDDLPFNAESLEKIHTKLKNLREDMQNRQHIIDQLAEDSINVRRLTETSRPEQSKHPDVDRLEDECSHLVKYWDNICCELADRISFCEECSELLVASKKKLEEGKASVSEMEQPLKEVHAAVPVPLEMSESIGEDFIDLNVSCNDDFTQLKKKMTLLEEKNALYVQQNLELKEELLTYKKRVQKLERDLSSQTARANFQDVITPRVEIHEAKERENAAAGEVVEATQTRGESPADEAEEVELLPSSSAATSGRNVPKAGKWTEWEEDILRKGVTKFGTGHWKKIIVNVAAVMRKQVQEWQSSLKVRRICCLVTSSFTCGLKAMAEVVASDAHLHLRGEDLESVVENGWNGALSFLQMCRDRCVSVESNEPVARRG